MPSRVNFVYVYPMDANRVASSGARIENAGEAIREIMRLAGYDPDKLPDADSLPPWTEEEADAFERAVREAGGQVEEPQHLWPP